MIICLNPLHKDNIYPMDKAMEIIYEEFGKDDGLVQTEVLQYMPGKFMRVIVGEVWKLINIVSEPIEINSNR